MADNVSHLPSIQGERIPDTGPADLMTEQEVDEYVDAHTEGVVECRMERRHPFPKPRKGSAVFVDIDSDGLFIAEYQCPRCLLAWRREWWEAVKRRGEIRYHRIAATTMYRPIKGQEYVLPKGSPRMLPRQVHESVMTAAMSGQSVTALRKSLQRND